jgi:hypothetical protein
MRSDRSQGLLLPVRAGRIARLQAWWPRWFRRLSRFVEAIARLTVSAMALLRSWVGGRFVLKMERNRDLAAK